MGSNNLATLSLCKVLSPPPQLQWSINVTLKEDYDWKGPDDVRYLYLTADDQPIDETCYQGQTIKGRYGKGTNIMVEQLCFNFKPAISRGDKLYLMLFWSQGALSARQVVYLSLSPTGDIQAKTLDDNEKASFQHLVATKNLITE